MGIARAGRMLHEDLLAAIRAVSTTTTVRVTADLAVHVPHIVLVFFVELVVRDLAERRSPEVQRLVDAEANALQEQRVLQAAIVFEVRVPPERAVEVGHAGGEVLGKVVDIAGCDVGAVRSEGAGEVGAVGGDEALAQVVQDRLQPVIFVEPWKCPGCKLVRE
jgi:hypothetical protein